MARSPHDDQTEEANQSDDSSSDDEEGTLDNEKSNQMSKATKSNDNSDNQQRSNKNNWNSKFGKMASYRQRRSPHDDKSRLMRGPPMPHLLIARSRSKRATTGGTDDRNMRRPLMPHMLVANSGSRRAATNDTNTRLMRPLMPHRMLAINRDQLIKITGKAYPSVASTTDRSASFINSATTQENDDSSADDADDENNVQDDINEGDENDSLTCAVHCVFEKMEMTDSNGLPEHAKFLDNLLQASNSRGLRNFLQKSTDECFQQMKGEDSQDPCKYSTKLVSCLAEKGRQDCSDWPPTNSIPL